MYLPWKQIQILLHAQYTSDWLAQISCNEPNYRRRFACFPRTDYQRICAWLLLEHLEGALVAEPTLL